MDGTMATQELQQEARVLLVRAEQGELRIQLIGPPGSEGAMVDKIREQLRNGERVHLTLVPEL